MCDGPVTVEELLEDLSPDLHERFKTLAALTDTFCDEHLNDEYKELSRMMAACIVDAEAPVDRGKPEGWAAGVVHAVGWVNFLTDPEMEPHMTSAELAKAFGVAQSTMMTKSRDVRRGLQIQPMDPNWCLPSLLDANPLVWMLEVDDVVMDMRTAPREMQVAAFEEGLIPYIPADIPQPDESESKETERHDDGIIGRIGF